MSDNIYRLKELPRVENHFQDILFPILENNLSSLSTYFRPKNNNYEYKIQMTVNKNKKRENFFLRSSSNRIDRFLYTCVEFYILLKKTDGNVP